jgi:hypothetical protein
VYEKDDFIVEDAYEDEEHEEEEAKASGEQRRDKMSTRRMAT